MENTAQKTGETEERKQSPLTRELSATRRVVEILEDLPEGARKRVLAHASSYIEGGMGGLAKPESQEEFVL